VVNSNALLRRCGATIGGGVDKDPTAAPALLEGQANFYHTVLGSRYGGRARGVIDGIVRV
jgi:hypothetical protein